MTVTSQPPSPEDDLLLAAIRKGDQDAWNQLISIYEGRLLAFCSVRVSDLATCEDIVQETFIGFLTSLPNFDSSRSIEAYLFSICSNKLIDQLRRSGRRPTLPLASMQRGSEGSFFIPDDAPTPSAALQSHERKDDESARLAHQLKTIVNDWKRKGRWEKLKCLELLLIRGKANKEVAQQLGITEQQVANHKSDLVQYLKKQVN